jgi:hypothetical protein
MLEESPADASEEWRSIEGFPGYEISSHGRVRSFKHRRVIIRKPYLDKSVGYYAITLFKEGRRYLPHVHRIVATAFLGSPPPGYCTNHLDGVKTNNRVSNLEWTTLRENTLHAHRMGLTDSRAQGRMRSRLTEPDVAYIRRLYPRFSIKLLARVYKVSEESIRQLVRWETWREAA